MVVLFPYTTQILTFKIWYYLPKVCSLSIFPKTDRDQLKGSQNDQGFTLMRAVLFVIIDLFLGAKSINLHSLWGAEGWFSQKISIKKNSFYFLHSIFSCNYCSIDLERHSDFSGLCLIRAVLFVLNYNFYILLEIYLQNFPPTRNLNLIISKKKYGFNHTPSPFHSRVLNHPPSVAITIHHDLLSLFTLLLTVSPSPTLPGQIILLWLMFSEKILRLSKIFFQFFPKILFNMD